MANIETTEWIAQIVAQTILNSGKTKHEIALATGIAYRTLDRKLKGGSAFTFHELYAIAECLEISPSRFTPPAFVRVIKVPA